MCKVKVLTVIQLASLFYLLNLLYSLFLRKNVNPILDVISEEDFLHANDTTYWKNHRYIFIGGIDKSGMSVLDGLLGSQLHISSINVKNTALVNRHGCIHPDEFNKFKCIAPNNYGSYVTTAYAMMINNDMSLDADSLDYSINCHAHDPSKSYGNCAEAHHIRYSHITNWLKSVAHADESPDIFDSDYRSKHKVLVPLKTLRNRLYTDWSLFWDKSKLYHVEKDRQNGVQSLLLQEVFGRERASFIFLMKVHYIYFLFVIMCMNFNFHVLASVFIM